MSDSPTGFELAIVSDAEFTESGLCPHCWDYKTDQHRIILSIQTRHILGDVMLCQECLSPYMVVEQPILPIDLAEVKLKFKMI